MQTFGDPQTESAALAGLQLVGAELLALLKQGDAAPSPDVAKVISGQKTVADVFLKGTGDLA